MTARLHDSGKLWILFVEACGLELLLTGMLLLVTAHSLWVNADLFKQCNNINSVVTSQGVWSPPCLHRVSLRVATLCTAGVCLASNVKPGSLWNLTKASTGRGCKFTLILRVQSLLLGHTGVGQGHQKLPFILDSHSCSMNLKSIKVSVFHFFLLHLRVVL